MKELKLRIKEEKEIKKQLEKEAQQLEKEIEKMQSLLNQKKYAITLQDKIITKMEQGE